MAIINVYPYQDSHLSPAPFDWNLLRQRYPSPEAAITACANAIRAALSYAGFLIWWTSSIHDWTAELPELTVYKVRQLVNSCGSQRRGVLVDLQKDWRGIGLAHWIANNVPVHYPWDRQVAAINRFLRLSPTVLSATIPSPPHDRDSDIIMAGTSISEDIKVTLSLYDEFLQEIEFPDDHNSNPLSNNDDFSIYWIVDFRGWECRPLDNAGVAREYSNRYHWAGECDSIQRFTMWRFRPRYTSALVLGAGVKQSGVSKDCQRSNREIRELYKGSFAPRIGERFNLGGWKMSATVPYDEPLPKRFTSRGPAANKSLPPTNPTQDRQSLLLRMLPRDMAWSRPSSRATTSTSVSASHSPRATNATSRWVEEMTKASHENSRSPSVASTEERGRRRGRQFANPDPTFSRQGDRSASPWLAIPRTPSTFRVSREALVRKLRHKV